MRLSWSKDKGQGIWELGVSLGPDVETDTRSFRVHLGNRQLGVHWPDSSWSDGVPRSLHRIMRRALREQRLEDLAFTLVTPERFGTRPAAAEWLYDPVGGLWTKPPDPRPIDYRAWAGL